MQFGKKEKKEKKETEEAEEQEAAETPTPPIIVVGRPSSEEDHPPLRTIGLVGDLDEEKAGEIISGLMMMRHMGILKTWTKASKK